MKEEFRVNLLTIDFKKDGTLDIVLNENLIDLFESEEEMISFLDSKSLEEPLFNFANEILNRAKQTKEK